MEVSGQLHTPAALGPTPGKEPHTQSVRFGEDRNVLFVTGFEPKPSTPWPIRYTVCAIRALNCHVIKAMRT
jgi:hypothetical protein